MMHQHRIFIDTKEDARILCDELNVEISVMKAKMQIRIISNPRQRFRHFRSDEEIPITTYLGLVMLIHPGDSKREITPFLIVDCKSNRQHWGTYPIRIIRFAVYRNLARIINPG